MRTDFYAEISKTGKVGRLLLPVNGVLPPAPDGPDWYGVQWPTSPENTGPAGIRALLEAGFPGREKVEAE